MSKLKLFLFVFLLTVIGFKAEAQSTHTACYGRTYNYGVDMDKTENSGNGTKGSTYTWTIAGDGYVGSFTNSTTNKISVNWGATPSGKVITITVVEKNDTTGCTSSAQTMTVTIRKNPTVAFTSDADKKVCAGDVKTFALSIGSDSSADPLGYKYTWTVPTGATAVSTTSSSCSSTVAGTYTIALQENTYGCLSNSASATLATNPLPPANTITIPNPPIAANTFCQGGSVILSATAGYNYEWYKDTVAISPAATSKDYTAKDAGVYTVKMIDKITNCIATTSTGNGITVKVNPLPTATIAITDSPQKSEVCNNTIINFLASASPSTGTYTYKWFKDGTQTATTTAAATAVSTTGTTQTVSNYTATVTDANKCESAASTAIEIKSNPNPSSLIQLDKNYVTGVSFNTTTKTATLCSGTTVSLEVITTDPKYTYLWSATDEKDSSTATGGSSASYNATRTTTVKDGTLNHTYKVQVTDTTYSTNCSTIGDNTIKVVINPLPETSAISTF